eukprot:3268869-Rhodomonas_salina.1
MKMTLVVGERRRTAVSEAMVRMVRVSGSERGGGILDETDMCLAEWRSHTVTLDVMGVVMDGGVSRLKVGYTAHCKMRARRRRRAI